MTSAAVDILAGIGAAFTASMIAVTAWVTVCAVIRRKAPAPARPPVPATTPVPGITGPHPARPRHTPQRPSPAPGPSMAAHRTGGLECTVKVWKCGCILLFDGHGRVTSATGCNQPDDLDEELRRLAP